MTNKKLIEKLQEDMEMRGFSHHTKDSYLRKTKEIVLEHDTLYVIPNSKNGNSTANAYWLSSPSETYNYYLMGVYNNGMIRGNYHSIDDRRISTNSLFKI